MGVSERIINVQIKGSIAELAEESLAARVLAASAERDAAAADVRRPMPLWRLRSESWPGQRRVTDATNPTAACRSA